MHRVVLAILVVGFLLDQSALGEDWPHWRGARRNGIVGEPSGFEGGAWPLDKPAWTARVGVGCSSPLVSRGRLYVMGSRNNRDQVLCLDAATGAKIWSSEYACPLYGRKSLGDKGIYSGPTSTPELNVKEDRLFTLSTDGDLNCWDAERGGKPLWHVNLYDRYDAPQRARVKRSGRRDYGYTSSPLLHGDWLIVEVGGKAGNLIAFDKRTGKQLWASAAKDSAGHNGGPVFIEVEGVPCVAVHHFNGLLVARMDKGHRGETVASHPWRTEFANNIATLAVKDNNVVMTSAYDHYKIARLEITLKGARKVWEQNEASKVCSPVIHDGHVYWAWRTLTCLDFETGKLRWKGGNFGDPGSCVVTSDDRILVWGRRGDLVLAESAKRSPGKYRQLAAKPGIFRRDAWPHVVLANQRIYCKDRDGNLACFSLK